MIGWIIAAVILFLLFSPVFIVLKLDDSGMTVYVRVIYLLKFVLLGSKRPPKKAKKKEHVQPKKPAEESKKEKKPSVKIDELGDILHLAVRVLDTFCKFFGMYRCKAQILIGGDDPADVATEFGLVNAGVYGILSLLQEKIKIKRRNIKIGFDYDSDKVSLDIDFRFRIFALLFLIVLICTNFRDILNLTKSTKSKNQEDK